MSVDDLVPEPEDLFGTPPQGTPLDEARRGKIAAVITVGGSRLTAARYVGCSVSTIRKTAERDPEFAAQLAEAEAKHEILHLSNINGAGKEPRHWRAAVWSLELAYPYRYVRRRRGEPLTKDHLTQLLKQFAEALVEEIADEVLREKCLKRLDLLASVMQGNSA